MMKSLENISVVLNEPSHPGNIGAAARVMKNMGLSRLCLVAPAYFPSAEATARAAGADDILAKARIVDHLDQALEGSQFVVGTSARMRHITWPLKSPREMAPIMVNQANLGTVALIFGNEQSGLSNEQLSRCHYHLHIDTNAEFSSMNLAAAVQICCYELRVAALLSSEEGRETQLHNLASADQQQQLFQHLEQSLIAIGYLDSENPGKLMVRLRRLFARAQLEVEEVNILRGICKLMVK